ncbi:MAG: CRISPR-associated protein [Bacteroidales bacterium]|jgi:hypothetical protein|nr:CRISPR-associated protein [Bacteroidales bacterium]MDD2387477.1 CRISPR-associated protein [Bacteroidales bacterium]MDD4150963.1 CRISPR-associated protein [Bacteroidales bacterium]
MLINLSNHPSSNWGKSQTNTAISAFDEIVDMEFPKLNPEWDYNQIKILAEEYYNKILKELVNFTDTNNAVHLMGEMTFCFCLANMFKDAEIQCVASTTRRNAIEQNGIKTSVFEFVKFRNYF